MKVFKVKYYIVLIILCPLIVSSCKKSGKEIVEKITTVTTEKTAKGITKEASEKTLKTDRERVSVNLCGIVRTNKHFAK